MDRESVGSNVAQSARTRGVADAGTMIRVRAGDRAWAGDNMSKHILPTSATMIGVCMTVLSIGHLGPSGAWRLALDKLLAVDALAFLASAVLSFASIRSPVHSARREAQAESLFLAALGLLALAAVALAFVIR